MIDVLRPINLQGVPVDEHYLSETKQQFKPQTTAHNERYKMGGGSQRRDHSDSLGVHLQKTRRLIEIYNTQSLNVAVDKNILSSNDGNIKGKISMYLSKIKEKHEESGAIEIPSFVEQTPRNHTSRSFKKANPRT